MTTKKPADIVNETLKIDELTPHPRNYNIHPDHQKAKLSASLARFGQVRSVVVQRGAPGHYLIVAGHGLIEVAKERGFHEIRADVIPADWSPEQVEGYLLADNLTARESIPDEDLLLQLLQEQQDAGHDLLSIGTTESEITDLFAKATPPSLDDLADTYGDEPDAESFWPVVRLKLPPVVKEQFDSLMSQAPGTSEHVKFAALLASVDTATLAEVSTSAFDFTPTESFDDFGDDDDVLWNPDKTPDTGDA